MAKPLNLPPTSPRTPDRALCGVGFRHQHGQDLLGPEGNAVDWLEILSDNYLHLTSTKHSMLERLAARFPLSLHGVGLSVGSTDPLSQTYIQALKNLKQCLKPLMISDHLCWTMHRGRNSHDLLPIPYTIESLHHVAGRVGRIQETLGCRLYLENPSAYVAFRENHMGEAEFLARLCDMTGAGILLDINNLYVNHFNLGLDPLDYLQHLDGTSIGYLHIAGHTSLGTSLVDTHDQLVAKEVWHLYETVVKKWPHLPTILEWDGQVPPLSVLLSELKTARQTHEDRCPSSIHQTTSGPPKPVKPLSDHPYEIPKSLSLAKIQDLFFAMVTSPPEQSPPEAIATFLDANRPLPVTAGTAIYRDAYLIRLTKALREVYPTVHWLLGPKVFDQAAAQYFDLNPPTHFDIRLAGERFSHHLNMTEPSLSPEAPNAMLSEIASLEWAKHRSTFHDAGRPRLAVTDLQQLAPEHWPSLRIGFAPDMQLLQVRWDVRRVIDQLAAGEQPDEPESRTLRYMIYKISGGSGANDAAMVDETRPDEFELLMRLKTGLEFEEALHDLYGEEISVSRIQEAVQWLGDWCTRGLVTALHTRAPHQNQNAI